MRDNDILLPMGDTQIGQKLCKSGDMRTSHDTKIQRLASAAAGFPGLPGIDAAES